MKGLVQILNSNFIFETRELRREGNGGGCGKRFSIKWNK